jgi:putrescine importer
MRQGRVQLGDFSNKNKTMTMSSTTRTGALGGLRLRRALGLRDLVIYGVILVSPISPTPFFGILTQRGHGHAATTILIAMLAMLPTAINYGLMARVYPSAGSAFTYVGREISPVLGYVTGWGMVMDYLLNPLISIIWVGQQAHVFFPAIPYWLWAALFAGLSTGLTVQGIKSSARANTVMGAILVVVIVIFFVAATVFVLNHPHAGAGFFTRPFYDPKTWSTNVILSGTSMAMLTYIGFDGISTLSEECDNPRRNVLIATVLTCLIVGVLSILEVYAAQLVWPSSEPFPNLDTAFTFVAQRAWPPLFAVVGLALMLNLMAIATAAQLAVARLLYGMGRSGALPPSFFGVIYAKTQVPLNNVLFVGVFILIGALILPAVSGSSTGYELGGNLVNFGALIAFMGVNAAAFVRLYLKADKKHWLNLILPLCGFIICLVLWWNLTSRAKAFGLTWMFLGIAYGAWRTGGFRRNLADFDVAAESADS